MYPFEIKINSSSQNFIFSCKSREFSFKKKRKGKLNLGMTHKITFHIYNSIERK